MSAYRLEAAHAERTAAVFARDSVAYIKTIPLVTPEVGRPVSGDMLAVMKRGTPHQRRQRRKRAYLGAAR